MQTTADPGFQTHHLMILRGGRIVVLRSLLVVERLLVALVVLLLLLLRLLHLVGRKVHIKHQVQQPIYYLMRTRHRCCMVLLWWTLGCRLLRWP